MRKSVALAILALSVLNLGAAPLDEAREALDNGFPQVALVKLEEGLPDLAAPGLHPQEKILYGRALLESGQAQAAVDFFQDAGDLGAEGAFWLAQAHARNGDWREALDLYVLCAESAEFEFYRESVIGRARMLANLGRRSEALEILLPARQWPSSTASAEALLDLSDLELQEGRSEAARAVLLKAEAKTPQGKSRRDFLLARAAVLDGDDAQALQLLGPLLPWDASSAVDLAVLHAETLARANRRPEAETLLEEFIAANPDIPRLELVFDALERAGVESTAELKRWATEPEPNLRRTLAAFHLARVEIQNNNPQAALPLLERLAAEPGTNPLARETLLELAWLRLSLGFPEETLSILPAPGESPEWDFPRGMALARMNQYADAAAAFLSAARNHDFTEAALHNAALCEMLAGSSAPPSLETLAAKFPESSMLAAFPLQMALHKARSGDPAALESLEKAAESPKPTISGPARLALAEWKFQQLDFEGARLHLRKISTNTEPDRQAALNVFLADNGEPGGGQAAIELARAFLAEHSGSEAEPEVRMKLGELLYREGNFAAARVELEGLARKFPGSDNEGPALFLAAKAAARLPGAESTDASMLLFEEVAAMPGPLAHRARLEQAAIQASLGKAGEANVILDKILATARDPETRAAALMEKGKNLYTLGDTDSSSYRAAIEVWKQLAAENPDPAWRNQALVRIGTAQEKTGDLNAAVASYYEVFKPEAAAPSEFFWFHKAGFAAGRILESRKEWPEAIRVYELMAAAEGPRALEARNRIKKIRLENFIWDGG